MIWKYVNSYLRKQATYVLKKDLHHLTWLLGWDIWKFSKFFSEGIDDINQGWDFNSTPLHTAASFGQYEMCQYIISNVKETNPKTEKSPSDARGYTPKVN